MYECRILKMGNFLEGNFFAEYKTPKWRWHGIYNLLSVP
jgi:hypothetical protein